jgi:hypothetical protein
MRILALDLAKRMGVADGDSALFGRGPKSLPACKVEAVTLRGATIEERVLFLAKWLEDRLVGCSLVVTEAPMNPTAQRSARAAIDTLAYYFCLRGVAATFDVDVKGVLTMTVRQHFCGVRSAPQIRGRKRTAKEAVEARKFINEAVLSRAILLHYLPEGSRDWDCANACALWDYGCSTFARARPQELLMYGAPW